MLQLTAAPPVLLLLQPAASLRAHHAEGVAQQGPRHLHGYGAQLTLGFLHMNRCI